MKADHIVVGQGLAGSLLAWHLISMGRRVLVIDLDEKVTSSKVAAGLIHPLAGPRFSLPDGYEETLEFARKTYAEVNREIPGQSLFHSLPVARFFRSCEERELWEKRSQTVDWFKRREPFVKKPLQFDDALFHGEWGGIEVAGGGRLDLPLFLETIRQFLLERVSYAVGRVEAGDVAILPDGKGVRWRNVEAENLIFCEGWRAQNNPWFSKVLMNNARGDILRIECPAAIDESRILSRGGWIMPQGNGTFRCGSTFDHDFADESPTEAGAAEVKEKIESVLRVGYDVLNHGSAIRPVIRRSQVFIGRHPRVKSLLYCNGFGSKGATNGPIMTFRLAEHLAKGKPIAPDCDVESLFE